MGERTPTLTPYPLQVLLGRIATEWATRQRILDLPAGRFHHADAAHDLSCELGGRRAATPIGPAAGPHTQLAHNYVLGWLAGARVFECKTVQVLDDLEIARPCIDVETVGFNVEWSQELPLERSLEEYVKAWMLLDLLGRWEPLRCAIGTPGPHVFDVSVGYDLAGITSAPVARFLHGVCDATDLIDGLRDELPEPFAAWRDHPFEPRLATTVTLSTFHGCPPEEIEAIVTHLIDTYDLDVVVKLNPTLLGHAETAAVLHGLLGYEDLELDPAAFEQDLRFDRATQLIAALDRYARARGRRFGVKLTNTLVVRNTRGHLPGDVVYLSGAPLHVLAVTLLDRLVDALPGVLDVGAVGGTVQVSWSAGVDDTNVADVVGLGVRPVTVCTNLLQPGGYGHLSAMLKRLRTALDHSGIRDLPGWVARCEVEAREQGERDAAALYAARLRSHPGTERYDAAHVRNRVRPVDRPLERWSCAACNVCVTVCPNDAMLHLATPPELADQLPDRWQYLCLAELCNDCGNCETFCPQPGAPFAVKPRLYLDAERFAAADDGFLVEVADGRFQAQAAARGPLAAEIGRLETLLNAREGLPLRPADLAAVT